MGIERRVSLVKPGDEPGKAWPAIAMGFFVAFGGVLFGYDTGTISGILAMRASHSLINPMFTSAQLPNIHLCSVLAAPFQHRLHRS